MSTDKECSCEACKHGMAAVMKKQRECIARQGWFAHIVSDGHDSPTGFNYHTHGLELKYLHPDIQIVLPLPRKVAHSMGHAVVASLDDGMRFHAGTRESSILKDYAVVFVEAKECGRTVLRMILPERNGALLMEEMTDPTFRLQWADCNPAAPPDGQRKEGETI
jgi:hypothetical protein